jgi:SAM-dependent methyltransferase
VSEWDGASYDRLSDPQFAWGMIVLERLQPRAGELVLDVGCGSGRLTAELAARGARVVGVDRSLNMLREARRKIPVVRADALALPFVGVADAVFSTATFHWIADHDALFRRLFAALKPGGRLVAQCGGGPNLARFEARLVRQIAAPWFAGFNPWRFASAEDTAARLAAAGFVEVETSVEPAPTVLPSAERYRAFLATVILRDHLPRIPDPDEREALLEALTGEAARDTPPFSLDYWRLNLRARRPEV